MEHSILDGLEFVDSVGRLILASIVAVLLVGMATNLLLRRLYVRLDADLRDNESGPKGFTHPVLRRIARDAEHARTASLERDAQALIEDAFQSELRLPLLAERFVRSATGLAIILGLLGTFYGLTLSVGRLVHLVAADTNLGGDVAQTLTSGLTQALTGMAVAFSNSLLGIASAVVLTVLGVLSNVSDRRAATMVQIETYLERVMPRRRSSGEGTAGFAEAVARLAGTVTRFESALQTLASDTRGLREFNVQIVAAKPRDERER